MRHSEDVARRTSVVDFVTLVSLVVFSVLSSGHFAKAAPELCWLGEQRTRLSSGESGDSTSQQRQFLAGDGRHDAIPPLLVRI